MKEVVIIRDETLTFDLQHTLIPACQRWGGTRWSHDRSVVSESVGDYVEQGVIKDTPQPNRMKRDRWLTGLCLDSVEQEQNKCSSRGTSTLSALPKECEEAEFLTKETCLISVCVWGGHSEAGPSETWAPVTRSQPETRYTRGALEDRCTSFFSRRSLFRSICSSPSDRVQMSTFVSFKRSFLPGLVRPELEPGGGQKMWS